ncbi:MAG: hypothetical protein GY696_11190 [Gammaproteobacteria bacterium]|nr:hypothetical protein [Gammaproteobacteria bacterium]
MRSDDTSEVELQLFRRLRPCKADKAKVVAGIALGSELNAPRGIDDGWKSEVGLEGRHIPTVGSIIKVAFRNRSTAEVRE